AADENAVAVAADQRVGPEAADQEVSAGAPHQHVVAAGAVQDGRSGAARGVKRVVAVTAQQDGRQGEGKGDVVGRQGEQLDGVVASQAVHHHLAGGSECAEVLTVHRDHHLAGCLVGRLQRDLVVAAGAADVEVAGLQLGRDYVDRLRSGGASREV